MSKRIIKIVIALIIVAALAAAAFLFLPKKQSNAESEAVLDAMEQLIPNFGTDADIAPGLGKDPLSALSIEGIDIVGGLEIPSIGLRAPVTAKGIEKPYFATWLSGSPVKGNFCLIGGENDVFSRISKGKPGEKVVFTDIDGIRYEYTITTQFHLKEWSEADYDLMLCYQTDGKTKFVLACTAAE